MTRKEKLDFVGAEILKLVERMNAGNGDISALMLQYHTLKSYQIALNAEREVD